MNAKEIIKLNNEKRKQLTEENEYYYSDMLVYIRTCANKSEQQTEEVLLELLEHLLKAQEQGKTAKDVFGKDLRAYCDEVIEEIPGERTLKNVTFGIYLVVNLISIVMLSVGIISYAMHTLFDLGPNGIIFPLGTGLVIILISLASLSIWVIAIFKWIKHSTFKAKKPKKWTEFFRLWLMCVVFIGIIVATFILMPEFGMRITISFTTFIILGILLYITSILLNKKFRITK
ncbi:DUF1129 family protein [Oceanobacillus bengalensis]|uniref:DUF1129 family protein n=1 Tax=Oceanobacillus bengalensis TaxID=1435466 RepID=A0A494YSD5_9BACI|nr:DUF1129 family protein [Oceanobacillus bengalensis]RKQ12824.1 DUF1129 family protein [Oceanobacillus bengalensis]